MKTIEEIERDWGYDPSRFDSRGEAGASGCTYNPTVTGDPGADCNLPARWHFRCHTEKGEGRAQGLLACDLHRANAASFYAEAVIDLHEVGSACGLEGSWWYNGEPGCGSTCMTEETGLELGILLYAEQDRPGGDLGPS